MNTILFIAVIAVILGIGLLVHEKNNLRSWLTLIGILLISGGAGVTVFLIIFYG